jgi:hypothetical protein
VPKLITGRSQVRVLEGPSTGDFAAHPTKRPDAIRVFSVEGEANILRKALADSRHKVTVILGTIAILVTIFETAMYSICDPSE